MGHEIIWRGHSLVCEDDLLSIGEDKELFVRKIYSSTSTVIHMVHLGQYKGLLQPKMEMQSILTPTGIYNSFVG